MHENAQAPISEYFYFVNCCRKSWCYWVKLGTGPLRWRGEVSIGSSAPGDASSQSCEASPGVTRIPPLSHQSLTQAFPLYFTSDTQNFLKRSYAILRGNKGMSAVWNSTGWMEGCGRSMAHWSNNTVNWRRIATVWLFSFFLPIFGIWWERAVFIPKALIACYVRGEENTQWKRYSRIRRKGTEHLKKLRFLICLFFMLVRNVRGMKTENGYNLGDTDHSSS